MTTYVDKALDYLRKMETAIHNGYQGAMLEMAAYVDHFLQHYQSLAHERQYLRELSNANAEESERIVRGIREIVMQYAARIGAGRGDKEQLNRARQTHSLATAVIIILALVGLGSFLFISDETTAKVISPTVANLPLGITLMTILVIAVIAMPHRKQNVI